MYPLLSIPALHLEIRSYVVALILAVVVCHWLGPKWARDLEGIEPRRTRWILAWLGIAAFAGGRLHFLANTWALPMLTRSSWSAFKVWDGLHAGGAIVALVIATPIVLRLYGLSVGRFADALAPSIGVGIAVARVGCFLNSCCYGTPCNGPWCVVFPAESYPHTFHLASGVVPAGATESAAIHPIELYWVAAGLLATGAAFWAYARKRYQGRVALIWLAVYLSVAAVAEPFRAEHYPQSYRWWGTLQFEWIAFAMAAAALLSLAIAELVVRRRGAEEVVGGRYVTS